MHHMGGNYWQKWNEVMRQSLPQTQVKKGAEEGSWDPVGDKYGGQGGRLFITCMRTFMLEVYYRHLPIYENVYDNREVIGGDKDSKTEAAPDSGEMKADTDQPAKKDFDQPKPDAAKPKGDK